jgi:repressor LexA
MTIGERIKERRKQLGLTVDELSERLNKNRATIYRYESNDIEKLPTTVLEPLAKALEVTPAYLMGWEENAEVTSNSDLCKSHKALLSPSNYEGKRLSPKG